MPIVIHPYRQDHETAVQEFNRRLQSGGAENDLVFYERAQARWLPASASSSLYNEFFVAMEGDVVRGGYALKHQNFVFSDGGVRNVGYYHHPLSEGIVDKKYAMVGPLLLQNAMRRSPMLYCLGMGGYDRPLPKMLVRLGWSHFLVPFYFYVLRPARFLREMKTLRTSPLRRFAMDFGAYSGTGWAAVKAFQAMKRVRAARGAHAETEVVTEFGDWAAELWRNTQVSYAMAAVRDLETLRILYPASETHFTRLRINRNGEAIGWAVVGEKRTDAKYGSLRVGSIIDGWARPEDAMPVIREAARALQRLGVDLIVSNQSHKNWCSAMEAAGFLKAESNFIFAASKPLAELLQPFEAAKHMMHLTRADGDGLPRNF